ncbi:MAG: ABC transporter permease [Chloroflexi bacterium]|nr:ABC transporter permease [Chloroflexota bacterium]
MQRYIVSRLIQAIVSMFIVATIVFVIVRLSGSPLDFVLPEDASKEQIAEITRKLGLDKPMVVQFLIYLKDVIRGDLGKSIINNAPVTELIVQRLPATIELGVASMFISILIALPVGVYSAVRPRGLLDVLSRGFSILGQSMPSFWLGMVLIFVFAVHLQILPVGGRMGPSSYVLPALTLGWYVSAGIMRLVRSSMLDILDSEYIKFARAKGLHSVLVVWKHALKNAALPVLTFAAILFVFVLTGSVVVEVVFSWPGVGRLAIQAITHRDYPVVQGVTLILSAMYIVANLVVDVLYGYLNPKIKYQ